MEHLIEIAIDEKPIIDLKPHEVLAVNSIASSLSIEAENVLSTLRRTSSNYFKSFGVRPYEILFDPIKGDVVRASSSIGYINVGEFLFRLNPSIKGLDIGKCIGLAQKCGFGFLSKYRDEITRKKLSDIESYSTIDFFAQSLMAAISIIITNGLDRKLEENVIEATKIGGNIRIQESINKANIKTNPFISAILPNKNTPPNRYILTALLKCKDQCSSKSVIQWATSLIDYFKGVLPYNNYEDIEKVSYSYFSFPRDDYQQGLLLSKIVLDGSLWKEGHKENFIPMFTINLDSLFERYVSEMLQRLLFKNKFLVAIQQEYQHPTNPIVYWKRFVPDIVIKSLTGINNSVILDIKNKYTVSIKEGMGSVRNEDVFQIAYYCHSLKSTTGFLVFPGGKKEATKYPLRVSESKYAYEIKRKKAIDKIIKNNKIILFDDTDSVEINLYKWVIDLSGTLRNSILSVVSLAQFIADLLERKNGFT